MEARIYNGEKIVSSANGIEKAGQPNVNQWNQNIPLHQMQKETQNGLKI